MIRLAAAVVLALSASVHAQLLEADTDPAKLARELLEQQPGVASVAVLRNGVLRQASVLRPDTKTPIADWSEPRPPMFEIGSVSKVFTGLLLAQSVERGELALTDTLGVLLKDQAPGMSPGVASINLRQLVTHSSCLPRQVASASSQQAEREIRDFTRAQLWSALAGASVVGGPPCAGVYSNFGFAVLGELLSLRAGKPWDQLVRERITGPLGMNETVVRLGEFESRMALPFSGEDEAPFWDMRAFAGAGGLRSSIADLMIFAKAVAAGRQGPLGAAAERLVTPLGPFEGQEIGYAVVIQGAPERRIVSHTGLTGGYRTTWMLLPKGEMLVAAVSNAQAPTHKLLHAVNRSLYPVPSAAVAPDPANLSTYEGIYRYGRDSLFGFRVHDGKLYVRTAADGFMQLVPVAGGSFTHPEAAAQFDFWQDDGQVVGVTLRQGGRVVNAKRDAGAGNGYAMVPREQLEAFAGRYRMPWGAVMDVSAADGQLLARLPKQWRLPVFSMAEKDRFAYVVVKAELQFERDAHGRVVALVLHQNGEHRAPRVAD